jgi:hypothetical protein
VAGEQPSTADKIRRLEHPRRVVAFAMACVGLAAIAFVLGYWVRSPDAAVLDARNNAIDVYSTVQLRSVTDQPRIDGAVSGTDPLQIFIGAPAGADRAVITRAAAAPGGPLSNGAFLGSVSDRPVFLFSTDIPLFRDLQSGSRGSDVVALQKAMGLSQTGVVDSATLRAVRLMYSRVGAQPPGGRSSTYISASEFYTIAANQGTPTLVSMGAVGAVLDSTHPFAVLGLGAPFVMVRASVSEAEQIKLSEKVAIEQSNGHSVNGSVTSISEFRSAATQSGRPPGRDIRIDFNPGSIIATGAAVSVIFGDTAPRQTAVPTLAIRSDASGDFVIARIRGSSAPKRIAVSIIRNADGWSAVSSKELQPGESVLVSG